MNRREKERLKQNLFDRYAESAVCSGFSTERAYFCPLCRRKFGHVRDLTLEHVPFEALGVPCVVVLTCMECNIDSGPAQSRLLQAHAFHQLTLVNWGTGRRRLRLVLGPWTVNADVWRDSDGMIWADPGLRYNNPREREAFLREYEAAEGSEQISLSAVVKLDQARTRWAAVREAYLLLFCHWGYWFLRKEWAEELQTMLKETFPPSKKKRKSTSDAPTLHEGSFVTALNVKFPVAPTKGEFVTAKTPRGRQCWLVPLLIDDRWAAIPSFSDDDLLPSCAALWDEIAEMTANGQGLTNAVKVIVDENVRIASAFKVVKHEDSSQTPAFWLEIIPGGAADLG